MQKALDESLFFENHPEPMWVFDLETLRYLAVNHTALAVFGYSRDEFLAMSIADLRPDEDLDRLQKAVEGISEGLNKAHIWRLRRKSGDFIHVDIHWHTIEYQGRQAILASIRDVTEQVEARRKLDNANRLLRLAGQTAKLGAWSYDVIHQRLYWSPETAAIHDEPDDIVPTAEQGIAYYAPEHRDRARRVMTRCIEVGKPFDEYLELITARGRRIQVRAIGEAIPDHKGNTIAVEGALQDISELMEARTQSDKLSAQLRQSLESMSDAFFTLDTNWCFKFLNSQAERLLNQSTSDLIGRNIWEAFPDAVNTSFQGEYERAVTTGEAARFTEYYPLPLDTWFEVNAYPSADGLSVYFRDITLKRRRTEQLNLLESAVARQNDILLITEANPIDEPHGPRVVYANEAYYRRTGFTREETIGQTPRKLQGPNTQRAELDRIRQALETYQPVRAELINYTKSGEEFWLELDIAPISDSAGHHTHWVAVERDVTNRKAMESTLRERMKELRCLYNVLSLLSDQRRGIESICAELIRIIPAGLLNEEAALVHINLDGHETRSEPWSEPVASIYTNIYQGGAEVGQITFGYRRLVEQAISDNGPFLAEETEMLYAIASHLGQLLDRRSTAAKLAQSERLNAIGELTGGVAHDFNNLLTVILGNAELLSEQLTDRQHLKPLAEMTATAAMRGAELTNRLLAFARRQALEPKPVDVNQLLSGMDGLLRRTLAMDIDIEVVRAGGLWVTDVDPGQLEVAMLNLAINARDAMPDGGRLTIETANTALDDEYARNHLEINAGQYVMVSVSDTGTGMSQDIINKAFEPFFTTKDVGKGSGLGLSMVYGFVKQSGGHAKIYSELDQGTTIKLYFPRGDGTSTVPYKPLRQEKITGGNEHILVVEDDPLVREHLETQLKGLGYRVTGAENGAMAYELIRQADDIDLLFTDVVMPGGMNGRQLADAARKLQPELKILYTSGYTENAIVHHGRLDRGVELLSKPYRRQKLAAKVRKVLDQ